MSGDTIPVVPSDIEKANMLAVDLLKDLLELAAILPVHIKNLEKFSRNVPRQVKIDESTTRRLTAQERNELAQKSRHLIACMTEFIRFNDIMLSIVVGRKVKDEILELATKEEELNLRYLNATNTLEGNELKTSLQTIKDELKDLGIDKLTEAQLTRVSTAANALSTEVNLLLSGTKSRLITYMQKETGLLDEETLEKLKEAFESEEYKILAKNLLTAETVFKIAFNAANLKDAFPDINRRAQRILNFFSSFSLYNGEFKKQTDKLDDTTRTKITKRIEFMQSVENVADEVLTYTQTTSTSNALPIKLTISNPTTNISSTNWQALVVNLKREANEATNKNRFKIDETSADSIKISESINGYAIANPVQLDKKPNSIKTTLPAEWFETPDSFDTSRQELLHGILAQMQKLPAGSIVTIGDCKSQPEVALKLYRVAKKSGLKVRFSKADGTRMAVMRSLPARLIRKTSHDGNKNAI